MIVLIEQPYTYAGRKLLHNWNIQHFATGKVVGHINEMSDGTYSLTTLGGHTKNGNRYRMFQDFDTTEKVVVQWSKRRFASVK